MKYIIDINTWKRRDNYRFFQGFDNCWTNITSEIDCTSAFRDAKASGRSFFIYYLYAILRAVNEISELRFRTDKAGRVCFYDTVDVLTPIRVEGGTFFTIRVPYTEDFETFYRQTRRMIDNIPADGDPYAAEHIVEEQGDYDVVLLSAVPKLYFTSIVPTQRLAGKAQLYPLMSVGKAVERGDRLVMPLAWTFSHEFVDGEHHARFIELVQQYMEKR